MANKSLITLPESVYFLERGWLSSNNVLLVDDAQSILVDTGYHTHSQQTHHLVTHALNGRPLDSIINTHLHSDHCGGNAFLQSAFPDVTTWIPPGHAAFVREWDSYSLGYVGTGQYCPPFVTTNSLSVGQVFFIGGISWRCFAAPGHDPHSFILFSTDTGICITADALWENGFGVVFPEIEGEGGFEEVASTLDLIESLQPSVILPGHGAPFSDVSGALQRARSRLAYFLDKPQAHALYAAKVLVKFKLLELQRISTSDFANWTLTANYLQKIHSAHFNDRSFSDWCNFICVDLVRSGAAEMNDAYLINA